LSPLSGLGPEYVTVVDSDRKYVQVSDNFCQLVGYRREELIGKRYDDLTAPEITDIPNVFGMFARLGYMHGLWMLVTARALAFWCDTNPGSDLTLISRDTWRS
jgi:PAS domain-containing protein